MDRARWAYRRLSVEEIATLQGFEPDWVDVPGMSRWDRVASLGDAVPPPLAEAVLRPLVTGDRLSKKTAVEICAGIGGLASGAFGLEHLALIEHSEPAARILRRSKPWTSARVFEADIRRFDFGSYVDKVGLLSGGPPCQPWSLAGRGEGADDRRDLLSAIHELVGQIKPESFVFENVPGLVSEANDDYLTHIISCLRTPHAGEFYGVAAGILNAADFGLPQIRRRVFIIGLRGRSNAEVHTVFDEIYASITHRNPRLGLRGLTPWVTVGRPSGTSLTRAAGTDGSRSRRPWGERRGLLIENRAGVAGQGWCALAGRIRQVGGLFAANGAFYPTIRGDGSLLRSR